MTKKITRTISVYKCKIGVVRVENGQPYICDEKYIEVFADENSDVKKMIEKIHPGHIIIDWTFTRYKCSLDIGKFYDMSDKVIIDSDEVVD